MVTSFMKANESEQRGVPLWYLQSCLREAALEAALNISLCSAVGGAETGQNERE